MNKLHERIRLRKEDKGYIVEMALGCQRRDAMDNGMWPDQGDGRIGDPGSSGVGDGGSASIKQYHGW